MQPSFQVEHNMIRNQIGSPRKLLSASNKKIIPAILILTLSLLYGNTNYQWTPAAEPNPPNVDVTAVVKPRHIQSTEKATLELSISGTTFLEHIEAPTFNFLPAFIAVPLRSTTTPRLEADKIAVSMAWFYELIPQKTGDFSLSDIRFSYQGTPYFANPGTVRVSAADTYVDATTGGTHTTEAKVTSQNPYLNQAVIYTFRYLYTTILPTADAPTPTFPQFPDCLVEELPPPPNQTEQIRGQTFWVQTHLRRLYPQKTGTIVIEPAAITLPLKRRAKTLKTETIILNVQALPEIGKPYDFTGAVGEYQLTAHVDRNPVEADSALSLTLRISGNGNMQTVAPPRLPTIPGLTINGPNRAEETTPQSRVYVYALVPSQVGTLQIPSIKYPYWHTQRREYQTARTTPILVTVLPKLTDQTDSTADSTQLKPWLFVLSLFVLIGLAIASYFWARRKSKQQQSQNAAPDTPLNTQALSALKALASRNAQNTTEFGNALAQILYRYLCEIFGMPDIQRNTTTVRQLGTQAGLSEPILHELIDILTQCDYYRFSPAPLSAEARNALIARTETVISHAHIEIRKKS